MANVTFLGTGLMGAALAEAAAMRGDRVSAWNRSALLSKRSDGAWASARE